MIDIVLRACALALCFAAAAPLVACDRPMTATGVRQVVSTTSFGMCVGYCSTRLEISAGQAVLVRSLRGGRGAQELPEQRFTQSLTPAEWGEIARLAAAAKLDGLPAVIGCPDCADGGAELLTIVGPSGEKTISFEHGAAIEQAQPLLVRVRALRTALLPKD